jgi:hypothetical protein
MLFRGIIAVYFEDRTKISLENSVVKTEVFNGKTGRTFWLEGVKML